MTDAQTIYSLIYKQFKRKGYSVFPQVRNHPGSTSIRTADALAISQSALRDTSFIGFEIKVSKTDFKNELTNLPKADAIAQYCNKWYIVAPKGIVDPNDLPENWGLLEATETRLKVIKEASDLPCVQPTRAFVAMIARKIEEGALKTEYWRGYHEGKEQERKQKEDTSQQTAGELKKLREAIQTFETHSGISFYYWSEQTKRIGEVVKLIKEGSIIYRIERIEETLTDLLKQIKTAKQELEANPLEIPNQKEPRP